MLKNAPRILAVVMLVTIATLMVIAGSSEIPELFKKGVEAHTDPPSSQQQDPTTPSDPSQNPIITPVLPVSNLPKQPAASDIYAYTQSVEVQGEIKLEAVHQTASGILLVISGAPAGGDFSVARQSITIINMSPDGVLNNSFTLPSEQPIDYVCSQLSADGLIIAAKDTQFCFIYTIDYLLTHADCLQLEAVNTGWLFPLQSGFMFIAERAQNTAYLISGNCVQKSAAIQSGSILEIVELRSTLNVFINGINGYSIIALDKNLIGYSATNIPEKRALKVLPFVHNGVQKYMIAEHHMGAIYMAKHSSSFRESECERVSLGQAEGANIYQNGESILLLLKSASPRVYLMDFALNFTLSSSNIYNNVKDIYGCDSYSGGYLMLSKNGANLILTDLRNDGGTSTKTVSISTSRADFVRNLNGTISIFYSSSAAKIDIVGIPL